MAEKLFQRRDPMCILWAAEHRNALTEVADQFNISVQFVSMVLYGNRRSRDGRVERELKDRGAPITWKS